MVQRQGVDQWSEPELAGALGDGREKYAGRRSKAERRRVVFSDVIAIEAQAVIGFSELQPLFIEIP